MTRNEFIKSVGATVVVSALGKAIGASAGVALKDYEVLQAQIDEVTPKIYFDYLYTSTI